MDRVYLVSLLKFNQNEGRYEVYRFIGFSLTRAEADKVVHGMSPTLSQNEALWIDEVPLLNVIEVQ